MRLLASALLLLGLLGTPAFATTKGEQLFNATTLGSNHKSCNSCHPQGKGLQQSGDYDSTMLREIINFCIRDALKGKMLPLDAAELQALERYVRSLHK